MGMQYPVAEKFKSIQGEGLQAGIPMAFIRLVGCSVGKKICATCDTAFEKILPWQGGGEFSAAVLASWALPMQVVSITGGEPFDHDLVPLIDALLTNVVEVHVETSGTRLIPLMKLREHAQALRWNLHISLSPKPGFDRAAVKYSDEVKVIVPGLGPGDGWPTPADAVAWAEDGHVVFLQPRNGRSDIDQANLALCQELVLAHPNLRLSTQLHKLLRVR